MLKVKQDTPDIRIRIKARSQKGEAMLRELAKGLGLEVVGASAKRPRKPRKQD